MSGATVRRRVALGLGRISCEARRQRALSSQDFVNCGFYESSICFTANPQLFFREQNDPRSPIMYVWGDLRCLGSSSWNGAGVSRRTRNSRCNIPVDLAPHEVHHSSPEYTNPVPLLSLSFSIDSNGSAFFASHRSIERKTAGGTILKAGGWLRGHKHLPPNMA